MFVIMTYDTPAKRTNIFLDIGRKYLTHTQNSLLVGDLTPSNFLKLKKEISTVLESHDNVILIHAANRNNVDITKLSRDESSPGRMTEHDMSFHKKDTWIL